MSNSEAYEEVSIRSDGVSVVKRFEEDEFPVPAIAFEFTSGRDEGVSVRLTDDVPEGVEVEDLGFHPEYGSEYWTIDEDRITFERELEAEAEYTTVYGIRATGTDNIEQFLTEPKIEEVEPPLPEDEKIEVEPDDESEDSVIPESDDDVVKDVIAGEGEVPGLEEDEPEDDEEVETLDLKDPNASDSGGTASGSASESGTPAAGDTESVVAAMANEIRQNNVSVDDLKLLHRAFEKVADETGEDGEDGVNEARIQMIQSDVADLRAYTDALEEFLDENGTGEQLIEDFEEKLSDFSEDLEGMREEVSSVSTEMDGVSEDVSDIGSTVDDLEATVDDLQESVEELEAQVTEEDVAQRVDDVEEDLQDLRDWQEQIKQTFGG
jgi:outer membrane murein-binding lipoprotein Lpp